MAQWACDQAHKVKKNAAPSFLYFAVFERYARKGYLCKGADGKSLPCSAQGILPAANTPTCPDIQKYVPCYLPCYLLLAA